MAIYRKSGGQALGTRLHGALFDGLFKIIVLTSSDVTALNLNRSREDRCLAPESIEGGTGLETVLFIQLKLGQKKNTGHVTKVGAHICNANGRKVASMECHQCQNVTIYLYTDITSLLLTTSHVFINLPNLYRHFIRIEILFG